MGEKRGDLRGMARPSWEPSSAGPMPRWMKVPISGSARFERLKILVKSRGLHTVCQSANCPNIGACWSRGAVTFMILGDICTRSCGFCDVRTGRPLPVDPEEPLKLAESLASLELDYAVVTSVDRDDLPDGGSRAWAEVIRRIKERCPRLQLEALVPDFGGDPAAIDRVATAAADVFAHNLETVRRLQARVRPQASHDRSLEVIRRAHERMATTKSGIMVGLGETDDEVVEALRELRASGCDLVTIGQYLRPSMRHLPVVRWVSQETFEWYRQEASSLGFASVMSAPLVRSSYRAEELARTADAGGGGSEANRASGPPRGMGHVL